MVVLDEPQATVGQLVKDLETIIKLHPGCHISFLNALEDEEYISGARFLENGLLLLESVSDPDDAIDAQSLLKKLKKIYPETRVVLQACDWMIINMVSDPDLNEDNNVDKDAFFYCLEEDDDEDKEAYVLTVDAEDIRLINLERWMREMARFAENPNRKVFCLDEYGNASAIRHHRDMGECIMMHIDSDDSHPFKDSQPLTIADFLKIELDYDTNNLGVVIGFLVCKSYKNGMRTVKFGEDGNIFFETTIDGEDVIACRLGERVTNKAPRDKVFVDPKDYDNPEDDTIIEVDDDQEDAMTKDEFVDYLKHTYIPDLKERIEEEWKIAERDEDDFDCEFEDDEYVECIARAEGSARAVEEVVRELESLLKIIGRFPDDKV